MTKEFKTFNVEMDISLMTDMIEVIEYVKKYPCQKSSLWKFQDTLRNIILNGCFKHNILTERFEVDSTTTHWICPKCCPKEYKEYKQKYSS